MLLDYKDTSPAGRPRNTRSFTKEQQAIIYDFLVNDINATQASKALGVSPATFRNFLSYIVQYWINIGFMGFTREVDSEKDFIEKEVEYAKSTN